MNGKCALPLLAALLLVPPAIAEPSTTQGNKPQVQFVQVARGMTIKDGTLTLTDTSPMTVFFSDRPQRLTGQVRNDLFVRLWSEGKNSFKSDPPNAALTVFDPQGPPKQMLVVLTNPRLDQRNVLYDIKTLSGELPAQGGETALFIDGYDTPCNSGLNDPAYSSYPCWAATAFSANQ